MTQNPPPPSAEPISSLIGLLQSANPDERERGAAAIFQQGVALAKGAIAPWLKDAALCDCLWMEHGDFPKTIVGIAVDPASFDGIRAATGMPALADVPPDQDAKEFELEFPHEVRLDVLTTRDPGGPGAIAGYLRKLGMGIQQVEIYARDIERATAILRESFGVAPVYPAVRAGADGTRVNFFLVPGESGKKVLIEIVEETPNS